MNKWIYAGVCMAAMSATACSSKKENKGETIVMQQDVPEGAPQRMQVSEVKSTFSYKGREYTSEVTRRPDESLPIVTDTQGDKYLDNRITLRLSAAGRMVVERVFTKESFASVVEPSFMKHAILEGLVYDRTTAQGIVYAASVAYPQSDLYIPIRLTVSAEGGISITKEEALMDYQAADTLAD